MGKGENRSTDAHSAVMPKKKILIPKSGKVMEAVLAILTSLSHQEVDMGCFLKATSRAT